MADEQDGRYPLVEEIDAGMRRFLVGAAAQIEALEASQKSMIGQEQERWEFVGQARHIDEATGRWTDFAPHHNPTLLQKQWDTALEGMREDRAWRQYTQTHAPQPQTIAERISAEATRIRETQGVGQAQPRTKEQGFGR